VGVDDIIKGMKEKIQLKEPKIDLAALSDLGSNNPYVKKLKTVVEPVKVTVKDAGQEADDWWNSAEGLFDKLHVGS